ncbi:MAG TPA: DUF6398 domain-containing protein [Gemmatales bacterium]|nr:DUF6398 domain-containing protein [Gemmatales bacterium]
MAAARKTKKKTKRKPKKSTVQKSAARKKPAPRKKPSKPRLHSLAVLKKELTRHTDAICKAALNKEYQSMCRMMVKGFCIEESPGRKGDIKTWAAAVVGAVGYVNALFKKGSEPHLTKAQVAKKAGVPLAEFNKHLKIMINGFDLIEYDPDFTLPSMIPMNPLIAMATSPTLLSEDENQITICDAQVCCGGESCSMEECAEGECSMEGCEREDCCQNQAVPTGREQEQPAVMPA